MTPRTLSCDGGDPVIVDAGGFGRETAQAVHDVNRSGPVWRLLGYLDDNPARHGEVTDGTVILGGRDVIDDFATLASGVRFGGGVKVQRAAYLGAGALIRENGPVAAFSLVGMGAVVIHDVPARQVGAGVPARCLRAADVPGEPSLEEAH